MKNKEIPPQLLLNLSSLNEFNEYEFIAAHDKVQTITSIRLNLKKEKNELPKEDNVPWCTSGYYLNNRPNFTADPLFHAGCYYVQEASSMFIEHILKLAVDLKRNLRVLDLCAAPGGKTTLISSVISENSFLIANEVIKSRVHILEENITKWGSENVIITNNDPKDFSGMENYFDVILVDAPCSGSGLFRKNNGAIDEWSEENVLHCSQRQQRILADIIPALKENGVLIYSTCSYSPEENEKVCDYIADNFGLESQKITINEKWGVVETVSENKKCFGYRFYPDKIKGEGFFAAAFVNKNSIAEQNESSRKKVSLKHLTAAEIKIISDWVKNTEQYSYFKKENSIIVLPTVVKENLDSLSHLYIRKAGVAIGEIMNGGLIPSHELAMSKLIADKITRIEVEKDLAIKYLKRDTISLSEAPKGWVLLTYLDMPLGWAKNLGNRINNYYPKNWRIMKPDNNVY
jgi:NOL1/NOP2/sun family putative RNA methylase